MSSDADADGDERSDAFADLTTAEVRAAFERADYVAEEDIVTTVLLALRLDKPLLVEGAPGAGKTELAKVLADGFDSELIRLQCYEGLAAENTLYEWNYTKQLLAVQTGEHANTGTNPNADASANTDTNEADDGNDVTAETDERVGGGSGSVFSEEYLLERPLLRALSTEGETPPVLLIDEIDRADEELEALLLEVLSDFQVTIPEFGTVSARVPPIVVITSNRTRGLSDALKRRCLYLHVEPPSHEKEREIVDRKVPELDGAVAAEVCGATHRLRQEPLLKQPGVAETLDWARAVAALRAGGSGSDGGGDGEGDGSENGDRELTPAEIETTLGCLLKEVEDVTRVDSELLESLLESARDARTRARG
jgi:MoxR-like ATPase